MFRKYPVFVISCLFVVGCLGSCSARGQKNEKENAAITPAAYNPSQYLHLLKGKKVGLMANPSSEIKGVHLLDSLLALGVEVAKVFSPEHGFRGMADAGEKVGNTVDVKTSIPIISLYGKKTKPNLDDLKGIDLMVFDIQDVGVRFFTYISSLHYLMEACAENQIPLVVLDRPNPNGFYVDGPVLKASHHSFVGIHPVPIVYGLTIGEFALMINGESWLEDGLTCDVTVIPCRNYTHDSFYKLPVKPSPNLPDMRSVYLYPSVGLFEGTLMSEGRGTMTPFQLIGHPNYPDTSFSFTPESIVGMSKYPKFRDVKCYGLDLRDISLTYLQNQHELQLKWLLLTYRQMNSGEFFNSFFNNLSGDADVKEAILQGKSLDSIRASWRSDVARFQSVREKYLIYP